MTNPEISTQETAPDPFDVDYNALLGDDDSPEEQARQHYLDMADNYVMAWADKEDPDLQAWYSGLTDEEKAALDEERKSTEHQNQHARKMKLALEASAPELLQGRLPASQAEALAAGLGSEWDYAIGVNQSGVMNPEEADQYVAENHGVAMAGLPVDQRFLVTDSTVPPEDIEPIVTRGYWGEAGGGKFVVAFPTRKSEGGTAYNNALDGHSLIDDMFVENLAVPGQRSVNPRYISGFIDTEGTFHANPNFMAASQPETTAPAEAPDFL